MGTAVLARRDGVRQMSNSYVYYLVQGDRDDPDHPNAFVLDKPYDQIVVGDVRQNFPLCGTFHFRFKIKYEAFGHVWLDLTDDGRKVPICDGKITCKVLPIDAAAAPGTRTITNPRTAAASVAQKAPAPAKATVAESKDFPSTQAPAEAKPQTRSRQDSEPLLDLGGSSASVLPPPQQQPAASDFPFFDAGPPQT